MPEKKEIQEVYNCYLPKALSPLIFVAAVSIKQGYLRSGLLSGFRISRGKPLVRILLRPHFRAFDQVSRREK
jgi:hypothetical protein